MSMVFHLGWNEENSIRSATLALGGKIVHGVRTFLLALEGSHLSVQRLIKEPFPTL